jgi:hypothetical protein
MIMATITSLATFSFFFLKTLDNVQHLRSLEGSTGGSPRLSLGKALKMTEEL